MTRGWWMWSLAALALAACSVPARDGRVDAEVRSVFDQLRRHQDAALKARFDPAVPVTVEQLASVERLYVPSGEPRARKAIGTNTINTVGQGVRVNATDEYDYGDRRVLLTTILHSGDGRTWQVRGLNVRLATAAQLAQNDLTLAGKSALQDLFLIYVIASPLLMVAALVKVIRTPGLKRKWLWGIAAFAGVFSLSMNWTTGQAACNFFTVQLLGTGVTRAGTVFAPWMLSATVPVGALLILAGLWANPRRAREPASAPDLSAF